MNANVLILFLCIFYFAGEINGRYLDDSDGEENETGAEEKQLTDGKHHRNQNSIQTVQRYVCFY